MWPEPAIYITTVNARLLKYISSYVAEAAIQNGIPTALVPAFIQALADGDNAALLQITGVATTIIISGVIALRQAFADGIRIVFIIAAASCAVAGAGVLLMQDLTDSMNYRVDVPSKIFRQNASYRPEDRSFITSSRSVVWSDGIFQLIQSSLDLV